jgi:type VI secretion system protein
MALFSKFSSASRRARMSPYLASIVENMNNVLNTKRDFGSLLRDFGVRDLSEHRTRDDIALAVVQEVRECIERYEPRVVLEKIALDNDNNPMRLSFTIQCSVRHDEKTLRMVFDTVFGSVAVRNPVDE